MIKVVFLTLGSAEVDHEERALEDLFVKLLGALLMVVMSSTDLGRELGKDILIIGTIVSPSERVVPAGELDAVTGVDLSHDDGAVGLAEVNLGGTLRNVVSGDGGNKSNECEFHFYNLLYYPLSGI